jgi:hypothetical protein
LSIQPNDAWLACHVGNSKENSGLPNARGSETSKFTRNVNFISISNVYNDDEIPVKIEKTETIEAQEIRKVQSDKIHDTPSGKNSAVKDQA